MTWMNCRFTIIAAVTLLPLAASAQQTQQTWQHFNGDLKAQKYSPHTQITPDNVRNLAVACKVHTGDKSDGTALARASGSHVGEPSSAPGKDTGHGVVGNALVRQRHALPRYAILSDFRA
jgi:quinoprotein glucose dehydrogenase